MESPPVEPIPPRKRGPFLRAVPALLVIFACIPLYVLLQLLVIRHSGLPEVFSAAEKVGKGKAVLPTDLSWPSIVFLLVLLGAAGTALLGYMGALFGSLFHPPLRVWIERLIGWMAQRPLPALHLVDIVACMCTFMLASTCVMIALSRVLLSAAPAALFAYRSVMMDVSFAALLIVALALAWIRAGGMHGSLGFFPPWSSRFISPKRPFWHDIGLGLACYPIALLSTVTCAYLNRLFVTKTEDHPIIPFLLSKPPNWVIATIVISGTFGAAFFEEIIFRGMLYNSLRRWLGGPSGAIVAAFLFALGHGLPSQIFALFALGAILTWLYDKTGRLIAGMTLHFTFNMVTMINVILMLRRK